MKIDYTDKDPEKKEIKKACYYLLHFLSKDQRADIQAGVNLQNMDCPFNFVTVFGNIWLSEGICFRL